MRQGFAGLLLVFIASAVIVGGVSAYLGIKSAITNPQKNEPPRFGTETTTGNFPTTLNNFQDGDIINSGDWNNIEETIGTTNSATSTTIHFQIYASGTAGSLAYLAKNPVINVTTGTIARFSFTNATGTTLAATTVSSTYILFNNATGTANLSVATLNVTNADEYRLRSVGISVMNPTSSVHQDGAITFPIPVLATLIRVECYSSQAGTSTIQFDRRASSTPLAAGTDLLSSQLVCGAATGTALFASSTLTAGSIINLDFDTVVGAPSSTNITFTYRNND